MDLQEPLMQVGSMLPKELWILMAVESLSKIWAWPLATVICTSIIARALHKWK